MLYPGSETGGHVEGKEVAGGRSAWPACRAALSLAGRSLAARQVEQPGAPRGRSQLEGAAVGKQQDVGVKGEEENEG